MAGKRTPHQEGTHMQHVIVYRDPNRYAGWPALEICLPSVL